MFSSGLLHMDTSVLANQQKLTLTRSIKSLNVYQEQGMDGERESEKSMQLERLDDIYIYT